MLFKRTFSTATLSNSFAIFGLFMFKAAVHRLIIYGSVMLEIQ
jgi:hypothetical protein